MDTVGHLRNMIIEEFELDPDKVQPDTDLTALGIDSLSVIEFLFKIEDTFKVTLPDRRVEEMKGPNPATPSYTIRGLAAQLDDLLAAQKTQPDSAGLPT